jgi:osmotically-inducible protein OsmY
MRERVLIVGVISIALLAAAAACNSTETSSPVVDRTGTPAVDDERLTTHVQARYQDDPSVSAAAIDVASNNGVVTLRGTVPTNDVRQQAEVVAKQVDGVRSVNNQLEIAADTQADRPAARPAESGAPTARTSQDLRSPGWITTKIQAQYFVDPEIKPWNIDVTTSSDGVVTLRGEVDSVGDRDEAIRIARDTEGVTRVDDRLRVEGDPRPDAAARTAQAGDTEQPDPWLTATIQAKYFLDADVKGRRIDVDTRDGVVTLTGEVEDEAERRQAIAIARNTEGVRSITDQLRIATTDAAPARATQARDRAPDTVLDDTWITTKIQSKLFIDQDVKGRDIDVDTRRGVVTLSGTVDSAAEKQTAEAIAKETDGVSRVINRLTLANSAK